MRARYASLLRTVDDLPSPGAARVLREVFWRPVSSRTQTPVVVDLFPAATNEAQRDPR